MSVIEEIRARHSTKQPAARELGRGLMCGKRDEFKLGYSWQNAAYVAIGAYKLSKRDATELRCYLYGFALGLHKTEGDAITEATNRLFDPENYRVAFRTGLEHGWAHAEGSYPAEVKALDPHA